MKLSRLNVKEKPEVEKEEEDEIDEFEDFIQKKLKQKNFGQSCNYTRLNTYGHDDVLGGK